MDEPLIESETALLESTKHDDLEPPRQELSRSSKRARLLTGYGPEIYDVPPDEDESFEEPPRSVNRARTSITHESHVNDDDQVQDIGSFVEATPKEPLRVHQEVEPTPDDQASASPPSIRKRRMKASKHTEKRGKARKIDNRQSPVGQLFMVPERLNTERDYESEEDNVELTDGKSPRLAWSLPIA